MDTMSEVSNDPIKKSHQKAYLVSGVMILLLVLLSVFFGWKIDGCDRRPPDDPKPADASVPPIAEGDTDAPSKETGGLSTTSTTSTTSTSG